MGVKLDNNFVVVYLLEDLIKLFPKFRLPITIGKPLKGNFIAEWELKADFVDDSENLYYYHQLSFNYGLIKTVEQLKEDIVHELTHAFLYEQNTYSGNAHGIEFCTIGARFLFEYRINIFCNSCSHKDVLEGIKIYFKLIENQQTSQGCEDLVA